MTDESYRAWRNAPTRESLKITAILSAIKNHPELSNRAIARLVGCNHVTVADYRFERGGSPYAEHGTPREAGS